MTLLSSPMAKIEAPFTSNQVMALEAYQKRGNFHPFTCPNRGDTGHRRNDIDLGALVPTIRGWICPYCDYTQNWAHAFMGENR